MTNKHATKPIPQSADTPEVAPQTPAPVAAAVVEQPMATPDEEDFIPAPVPDTYTPPKDNDGAALAEVDPDKFVANSCMYHPLHISDAQRKQWYVVRYGDVDEDGELIVRNQQVFRLSPPPENYLLHGDSVVLVRRRHVHEAALAEQKARRDAKHRVGVANPLAPRGIPVEDNRSSVQRIDLTRPTT